MLFIENAVSTSYDCYHYRIESLLKLRGDHLGNRLEHVASGRKYIDIYTISSTGTLRLNFLHDLARSSIYLARFSL